jgi:hypothetical protein
MSRDWRKRQDHIKVCCADLRYSSTTSTLDNPPYFANRRNSQETGMKLRLFLYQDLVLGLGLYTGLYRRTSGIYMAGNICPIPCGTHIRTLTPYNQPIKISLFPLFFLVSFF